MLTNASILIAGGTCSCGHIFAPLTLAKFNPRPLFVLTHNEEPRQDR